MPHGRSIWAGIGLLVLVAVVAATVGSAPAAGAGAADTRYLVVDRFDAAYDGNVTTNYKVTASSWENQPIAVNWKMTYTAGRCGNFTVPGAEGIGSAFDTGNTQGGTVPAVLGADGYFTSTAAYNHEGCDFTIESNEVVSVEVVRKEPAGPECRLTYVQRARDHDEPPVGQEFPQTTAVGICSFAPPPPPPPPPPPSPPPPPPKMSAAEKQVYRQAALTAAASGTTFGVATIALIEFPPAAAISLMFAGVSFVVEAYNGRKALDPPDPNYRQLVVPSYPKPRLLRATGGITRAEAAAANALLANTVQMVGQDRAFLTSLERAQGADAAGDAGWLSKQSSQAIAFARAEAKTLDARPALEKAIGKAMTAAGHTQSVTTAAATKARKAGLPAALVALLRSFGVNASELATFRLQMAKASPTSASGPVSARFGNAALAAAERKVAKALRALADRLENA